MPKKDWFHYFSSKMPKILLYIFITIILIKTFCFASQELKNLHFSVKKTKTIKRSGDSVYNKII